MPEYVTQAFLFLYLIDFSRLVHRDGFHHEVLAKSFAHQIFCL